MRFIGRKDWPYRNEILGCIWRREWSSVKRILGFWWEWLCHGYSQDELWSLDVTLAQFILPRLKGFRDWEYQVQGNQESERGWLQNLDKMVEACELVADSDRSWQFDKDQSKKVLEGFELFGKYFTGLWN